MRGTGLATLPTQLFQQNHGNPDLGSGMVSPTVLDHFVLGLRERH
jgi:hypothetical protein